MPHKDHYAAVLLKKRVAMAQPFWPRLSQELALTLHNSSLARSFNTFKVLDEIAYMEAPAVARPTSTKPATKFRGAILGRFWHKHFTDARFLGHNLQNQWWGPYATKNQTLSATIREAMEALGDFEGDSYSEAQAHQVAGRIAHDIVIGGMEKRATRKAMTGEWIIYYPHDGMNYYLGLAHHEEQKDERALYDRLKSECAWEFPFAFEE